MTGMVASSGMDQVFCKRGFICLKVWGVHLADFISGGREGGSSQPLTLSGSPTVVLTLCFLKLTFSKNFFQEHSKSVKRFRSRSGPTILSGLIWVQTVCKDYQQMTKFVVAGKV